MNFKVLTKEVIWRRRKPIQMKQIKDINVKTLKWINDVNNEELERIKMSNKLKMLITQWCNDKNLINTLFKDVNKIITLSSH